MRVEALYDAGGVSDFYDRWSNQFDKPFMSVTKPNSLTFDIWMLINSSELQL